jgi:hypothetical protein
MFTATSSSNRRRIQHCRLHDLLQGGGLLEEVAKYLAPPSRIMFVLAVTPPKSPYETIMARSRSKSHSLTFMIAGSDWEILDFGEFEKDLAAKLTDNDLSAILVHIDAVNKVKRLKLTNCINITGIGLQPLRGSRIIEYIDLSLTRSGQNSRIYENPAISCNEVLPILDSMIAAEGGCAVRKIEFPMKWREGASVEFRGFLERYNALWVTRTENNSTICRCAECEQNVLKDDGWREDETWVDAVGDDYFTCSACLKHFCADCKELEEDAPVNYYLLFACGGNCGKQFCFECSKRKYCGFDSGYGCGYYYCTDCHVHIDQKCGNSDCNTNICDKCISRAKCTICEQLFCGEGYGCQNFIRPCDCCHEPVCSGGHNHPMSSNCSSDGCDNFCSARFCKRCSQQGKCSDCGKYYCSSCQSKRRHKLSNIECKECLRKIATGLMGENEQLRAEKEELRKEFERWHL